MTQRSSIFVLCALSCLASSCKDKDEKGTAEPSNTPPTEPTEVAPKAVDEPEPLRDHMALHFAAIQNIERSIVQGQLESAVANAAMLVEHETHEEVADYDVEVAKVKELAQALAAATSIDEAAPLTAKLAGECGTCHSTMTAITSFEWVEQPENDDEVKQRMQRHQWAMDRLWEGIVGPSDVSWTSAAEILSAAPLPVDKLVKDAAIAAEVGELASKLQALGVRAEGASEPAVRVEIYGELLKLCSQCHAKTRK